jgi:iron complex outermembrane receptor protein
LFHARDLLRAGEAGERAILPAPRRRVRILPRTFPETTMIRPYALAAALFPVLLSSPMAPNAAPGIASQDPDTAVHAGAVAPPSGSPEPGIRAVPPSPAATASFPAAPIAASSAGAPAIADSAANRESFQLDKVTVTAGVRGFARRESGSAARLPLKHLENPHAYTVVRKELGQEQVAVSFSSLFKNVPGAAQPQVTVQGLSRYATRGFYTANQIRNGMPVRTSSDIELANIEAVEAIRGPAGALYGAAAVTYGGLFNRVTKRPYDTFGGEVSYAGGSWNLSRLTADLNTPLNPERTALLRVNAALHKEGSHLDQGFSDTWMLAPSLSYRVNERLSVLLDAEIYQRKGTSSYLLNVSGTREASGVDELPMDWTRSYTNNSLVMATPAYNFFGQAEYRIDGRWKARTDVSYGVTKPDVAGISRAVYNDSLMRLSQMRQFWSANTEQIRQDILGDFELLSMRHRLLAGVEVLHQNEDWTYATSNLDIDTIDLRHPRTFADIDMDMLTANAAKLGKTGLVRDEYTYGAYVSDAVDLADRVTVLLGARFDKFDNRGSLNPRTGVVTGIFEQKAFSPKAGLVYEAVKDRVSLFANWMSGFKNATGASFENRAFVPEKAYQSEAGVKADALGGMLSGTASVYYIRVEDVVRADPDHATFSVQDGTQESRGVEADLAASPFPGLRLTAGYAYNESLLMRAAPNVSGRRPANSGPEHAANLWASYRLTGGAARGLGFGFGAAYSGMQYYSNTTAYVFTIPSYTLFDATLFYDRPAWRVGLKADNLTDERYWNMYLAPMPTRRFIGNVTYRF